MTQPAFLRALLSTNYPDYTWYRIIGWWEARRPAYNLILLVAGILSISILILSNLLPPARPDAADLGDPGLPVMVCAFGANLGYTLGWIVEILALPFRSPKASPSSPKALASGPNALPSSPKAPPLGPKLFTLGLYFSIGLIFLPAAVGLVLWLFRLL